jgi:hypothetical protein
MAAITNTMKLALVATPHGEVAFTGPYFIAENATDEQSAFLLGLPGYKAILPVEPAVVNENNPDDPDGAAAGGKKKKA